ncbi:hypothetical protein IJJ97_05950 [bacterium]|nr:hypothetical protein [bacterium]
MDWKVIWETAITNGIFCGLFIWLLFYVIRQNEAREKRLQELIDDYNKQLKQISETLIKIQEKLDKPKRKKAVSE